jgi:hypothetical protein
LPSSTIFRKIRTLVFVSDSSPYDSGEGITFFISPTEKMWAPHYQVVPFSDALKAAQEFAISATLPKSVLVASALRPGPSSSSALMKAQSSRCGTRAVFPPDRDNSRDRHATAIAISGAWQSPQEQFGRKAPARAANAFLYVLTQGHGQNEWLGAAEAICEVLVCLDDDPIGEDLTQIIDERLR